MGDALLRFLRVPPEPHLPAGAPGSARVFRAAPNYWRLKLTVWGLRQAATLLGFVILTAILHVAPPAIDLPDNRRTVRVPLLAPLVVVKGLEAFAFGLWLVQLPVSLAIIRLDYRMRWYVVTDRAARVREGVLSLKEMTFTLVNVQDIRIRQGPLQRALGLADVELRTAGGSESPMAGHGGKHAENLHLARFRGVDNAEMIRDLVLRRMRDARDAGLGDPDDPAHRPGPASGPSALEAAVLALTRESAALRAAVTGR